MNERDIHTRINNLVLRAYVTKNLSSDEDAIDRVEISYLGREGVNVEKLSPYGLCSSIPAGTQCLKINIAGKENNMIVIPYETKERYKVDPAGEVVVWNPKTESYIKFDKDGNIEIDSKANITINSATKIEITAQSDIDITTSGDANIKANNVNVTAAQTNLGTGGNQIARLGDSVQVDPGTHIGTITSAGTNTSI